MTTPSIPDPVRQTPQQQPDLAFAVLVGSRATGTQRPGSDWDNALLNQAGIATTPHIEAHNTSAWAQYTVQVPHRAQVQAQLQAAGIPTAVHYPIPLNQQPAVADPHAQLPVGDAVAQKVMSLPMHPGLDAATQDRIVHALSGLV